MILVARDISRRFLEGALRLEAFSITHKPLEREELLMQLRRIMDRYYPPGEAAQSSEEPGGAAAISATHIIRPSVVRFDVEMGTEPVPQSDEKPQDLAPEDQAQQTPDQQPPTPTRRIFRFRITRFHRG